MIQRVGGRSQCGLWLAAGTYGGNTRVCSRQAGGRQVVVMARGSVCGRGPGECLWARQWLGAGCYWSDSVTELEL